MNSLVILDDYMFQNKNSTKYSKSDFLKVVNYYLRHKNITLFLVIHNLYNTGLLNEILLSPHIFVAYSNLGYIIIKKLLSRLGGNKVLQFYQESMRYNYNFCYINCNKNYLINNVQHLLLGKKKTTMFADQIKYVIHKDNVPCTLLKNDLNSYDIIENNVNEYLEKSYPKNKNLHLLFKILCKNKLINDNLFFENFSKIHIADFCAFINNRFAKKETVNLNMIKLCKFILRSGIQLPRIAIKNPVALKLFSM